VFVSEKRCGKCGEVKPETAFNRAGDGRQHWCRECFKAYFKARGARHMAQVRQSQVRRRADRQAIVREHMREHPCADCGERDPIVLEFDHLDATTKVGAVSKMWMDCLSIDAIRAEIARCEVVCANCHRRRTAARGGWTRDGAPVCKDMRPRRERNIQYVYAYLRAHPCVDCGVGDPIVLEFDHVGVKRASVTRLAWTEYSLATIDREIAECEVRCCNCHRRRTAERRGSGAPPASIETRQTEG
jgi:hypothetical protein